jgi:hypothetical protein
MALEEGVKFIKCYKGGATYKHLGTSAVVNKLGALLIA